MDNWPLIHFLLCAADNARMGYIGALSTTVEAFGQSDETSLLALEAREEAVAIAPRVFAYRNDLLADTLLEAAYRVAENRGIGAVP